MAHLDIVPRDDAAERRTASEPSEAAARKLGLLAELLYNKYVRYSSYAATYGVDEKTAKRSFQRDLQHLRQIGEKFGFTISNIKDGERAELRVLGRRAPVIDTGKTAAALIAQLGASLGGAVAAELGAEAGSFDGGFARFIMPRMIERSRSKIVYDALKAAWDAKPHPASVEFVYDAGKGSPPAARHVEPYRVFIRSGRDYLLAYDLGKKCWRMFGLDAITTTPKRKGTIQRLRAVPPRYENCDAIGFFTTDAADSEVTVELSATVATSVIGREWQRAQTVKRLPGGKARITFAVSDVGEVIRWALGLGAEARVIAPPAAVNLTVATLARMSRAYETRPS